MQKKNPNTILLILFCLVFSGQGFCLDSKDIVELKKGGINGETIQVIIQEKVIETCAFTVQDILKLREAGMSNITLRKVIQSASFMKDTEPIQYGKDIRPIRFTSVENIIDLKKAGISDEVIKAIVSGVIMVDNEEYYRAWTMLEKMGLILDER